MSLNPQLDPATSICSLTDVGRQVAVAALLAELLFLNDCRSHIDLPGVYQKHFGVPLQLLCFGVDSVLSLLNQPNISAMVQVSCLSVVVLMFVSMYLRIHVHVGVVMAWILSCVLGIPYTLKNWQIGG